MQSEACTLISLLIRVISFEVGILEPAWLASATYLGRQSVDGFDTDVWNGGNGFITYYADVITGLPVRWIFFDNAIFDVLTFEHGAVLQDKDWQAPHYCFEDASQTSAVELGPPLRLPRTMHL